MFSHTSSRSERRRAILKTRATATISVIFGFFVISPERVKTLLSLELEVLQILALLATVEWRSSSHFERNNRMFSSCRFTAITICRSVGRLGGQVTQPIFNSEFDADHLWSRGFFWAEPSSLLFHLHTSFLDQRSPKLCDFTGNHSRRVSEPPCLQCPCSLHPDAFTNSGHRVSSAMTHSSIQGTTISVVSAVHATMFCFWTQR